MPLTPPSIVRIPIAPAGMINAFLICQDPCYILVDSGLPGTEDKVARALERLGKSYSDISLIIITHAHIDHAGNAALLSQHSGAPILAHEADLPFYLGEKKMTFCTFNFKHERGIACLRQVLQKILSVTDVRHENLLLVYGKQAIQ